MRLHIFFLLNAAIILLDGVLTLAIGTLLPFDIVLARLLGVMIALSFFYWMRFQGQSDEESTILPFIIICLGMAVSFGLFALVMMRNPMLQWPMVFAMSSLASLVLAMLGYYRARTRAS